MTAKKRHRHLYRPAWASDCLCGSGKKFRDCCHRRLPGTNIGEAWKEAARQEKWALALLHIRADIVQYTIWHLSHTAPPDLHLPHIAKYRLLYIDIEALSDHVGSLCRVYFQVGRQAELLAVLERLKANIDDPRWLRKIAYHRAITALWKDRRDEARAELKVAEPIRTDDSDLDLLQVHIDLYGSRMGFSERQAYFRRVIEITRSDDHKIQYNGALAFGLLLIGDEAEAEKGFHETIEFARSCENEGPLSTRGQIFFCKTLEGLAVLSGDNTLFAEIVERLTTLIGEKELSRSGVGHVQRAIGDAHRYSGNLPDAITAYRASYEAEQAEIVRVFEAECLARSGQNEAALELVASVDAAELDEAEQADYAFTYFHVARLSKQVAALEVSRRLLDTEPLNDSYFEKLRLQYLVDAQKLIVALKANQPPPDVGAGWKALHHLSRYAQLQPNIMGLGLNLNNMIDDAVSRAQRRATIEELNEDTEG